ncbi:MAG: DUF4190 domain-containing protein [Specibacter sp.]
MSQQSPSGTPHGNYNQRNPYPPLGNGDRNKPLRPVFSKQAISGFVIACISMFFFGFAAIVAVFFCVRALREIRTGAARGRGLAIAGIIVGSLSFVFYILNMFIRV